MFLKKIDIYNSKESFYKRNNYLVKFISSEFRLNTDVIYVCDDEFVNKILKESISISIDTTKPKGLIRIVLIDCFPDDLCNLIRLTKNIVYSFKMYLNDEKLDKLVKD